MAVSMGDYYHDGTITAVQVETMFAALHKCWSGDISKNVKVMSLKWGMDVSADYSKRKSAGHASTPIRELPGFRAAERPIESGRDVLTIVRDLFTAHPATHTTGSFFRDGPNGGSCLPSHAAAVCTVGAIDLFTVYAGGRRQGRDLREEAILMLAKQLPTNEVLWKAMRASGKFALHNCFGSEERIYIANDYLGRETILEALNAAIESDWVPEITALGKIGLPPPKNWKPWHELAKPSADNVVKFSAEAVAFEEKVVLPAAGTWAEMREAA
jgi:hypothetical protein